LERFVVKKPSSHNRQIFTAKAVKAAAKVRKGTSNTFATRPLLGALCADLERFVVKKPSSHNRQIFTAKAVKIRKGDWNSRPEHLTYQTLF
jgi:hypothetical protein